jgi:hypothetical protein
MVKRKLGCELEWRGRLIEFFVVYVFDDVEEDGIVRMVCY